MALIDVISLLLSTTPGQKVVTEQDIYNRGVTLIKKGGTAKK